MLCQVLQLMELETIRGALVGMPGVSGLSVEQRKRLTIGVELVSNPSIIFMDEPTSGAQLPACPCSRAQGLAWCHASLSTMFMDNVAPGAHAVQKACS